MSFSGTSDKHSSNNNQNTIVSISFGNKVDEVQSSFEISECSQPTFSLIEMEHNQVIQKTNMLRSPSKESVGTDISLFSVSTLASELTNRIKLLSVKMPSENSTISRGPSPNFDSKRLKRPENVQEMWFDETPNMIRGMAALSTYVGLSKSFSTSDIMNLTLSNEDEDCGIIMEGVGDGNNCFLFNKRNAISELAINSSLKSDYLLQQNFKFDNTSRSCSTWVAAGDLCLSTISQLASPHTSNIPSTNLLTTFKSPGVPTFSPVDLVRSVNKKIRQQYIRKRLLNTYKALERLSQSEFNLDKLEIEAAACTKIGGAAADIRNVQIGTEKGIKGPISNRLSVPSINNKNIVHQWKNVHLMNNVDEREKLTVNDVERERGQPLSKYDRNMMIFNWLLTLESSEYTDSYQ